MFPYINNDDLLEYQNLPANGTYYAQNEEFLIPSNFYNIFSFPATNATLELHLYDLLGNRLAGTQQVNPNYWSVVETGSANINNNINIDIVSQLADIGINRGQYYTVLNLHQREVGSYQFPSYYIKDISTDRTELRLQPVTINDAFSTEFNEFVGRFTEQVYIAINDSNRIFPVFNYTGYELGDPADISLTENYYYFDDPDIRLAFDTYIVDNINDSSYYIPGSNTFYADQNGTYGTYIYTNAANVALTIQWFIQANIVISPETIQTFAPEIQQYIILNNTASPAQYQQLVYQTTLQVQNSAQIFRQFWRRNLDGTYAYIGQPYFTATGNQNTLQKAGYSILPFIYPDKYILNFGNNNVARAVNFAFESQNSGVNLLVKLASPLDVRFQELDRLWIASEIVSPIIEKILLLGILEEISGFNLRGPNFDIDVEEAQSIATNFQNWNQILSSNVSTTQQIVDTYFSSSYGDIHLNINYGEFENFVHFGSAEERVANFKYKLELIEFYTNRINTLTESSASALSAVNITEATNNRNNVIGKFDDFEKYLFYETTGSQLYTFQSCSIQPWPKQNITDSIITYTNQVSTTGSIAETYYADLVEKAQIFDSYNIHSLRRTIPTHLTTDEYNEDYTLFVDMIGHYYDLIWAYIKELTQISSRQEHPKDGLAQDLVFNVAQSLGLNTYNGRSVSNLWEYVLGTDTTGSYENTGSMQSLSYDQISKEVWKRLVNNLPYLYKTKGTARSIKAILACYGIPTTILNIKEYGGVNSDQNDLFPYYVHDVYAYAYEATGSIDNYVLTPWNAFTRTQYSSSVVTTQYPDTIEFRFRTDDNYTYTPGTEYSILRSDRDIPLTGSVWSQIQYQWNQTPYLWSTGIPSISTIGDPFFEITFTPQNANSGSLKFYLSGSNGFLSASINNIYMMDNNWLTVALQRNKSTDVITTPGQSYTLKYKRGYYGKIVQSGSATISLPTTSASSSYQDAWTSGSYIMFGKGGINNGYGGSQTQKFYGFYQELRYWYGTLDDDSLENHTLSPYSYNGNEHYSAYYDLIFRTSLTRKNLVTNSNYGYMQMISQHPNQNINISSSAVFVDRYSAEAVPFEAVEETYHTKYADLTAHVIYSEKIRIESQSLLAPLNPNKRVTISSFDTNSNDSNKLGIYFSPQHGINEDIVNHLGYISLDDYIGDPRDQYQPTYRHLDLLRDEYWKKYQNRNDFEEYFRALLIYDLSIFRQIKKFVPARANLISGIVVEPNLLERNKSRYISKPIVEDLLYNTELNVSSNVAPIGTYVDTINITFVNEIVPTGSYVNTLTQTIELYQNFDPYLIGTYNSGSNLVNFPNVVMINIENDFVSDLWYEGTQSTSADINIPSPDTFNGTPVVESFQVDPNIIITQQNNNNGFLFVE